MKWTVWSLYAQVGMSVATLLSGYLEYDVLVSLRDGAYETPEAATADADASDARQGLLALVQMVISFASAILILRWIHRANWNVRALGARGMTFTPGWAIGFYFIPILCLWRPYQAMKEIWQASQAPAAWNDLPVSPLLAAWWGLWLATNVIANVSLRLALRADAIDELIAANVATLLSDAANIPLCVVLLAIIRRIQSLQDAWRPGASAPARAPIDAAA